MNLIYTISAVSGLLAIWIGLQIRGLLWYYVLLSFGCDILNYFFRPANYFAWNGNTFLLGEFLLVSLFLTQETIESSRKKRWAIYTALTISIVFAICASKHGNTPATEHGWLGINYKAGAILNGLLIPGTLLGFYKILHSRQPLQIEKSPLFIFCAGFLLYVSGSFMMMLFEPRLNESDALMMKRLWAVHNILNILKNLSIAYCLHLYRIFRRQ